ncbi:MAG: hypothetical protein QOG26_1585 [Solirubrobacterales bacterium]|nr:hypothetical protein [Solirubrobacterales bacterium]
MSERETEGSTAGGAERRRTVYCVVPPELAKIHDLLRRHFAEEPDIEVIIERRGGEDRRCGSERRTYERGEGRPAAVERRTVRSATGHRIGERRASVAPIEPPKLPRRLRRHAGELVFIERQEPVTQESEDIDSARLITQFQGGDRGAYYDLYMRYFDRVYSYLRMVLKDNKEAEDATQQVFLEAIDELRNFDMHSPRAVRAWLFAVVRDHALRRLREEADVEIREHVEPSAADAAADDLPALSSLDWVSDKDLGFLIERLPAVQRQALLLHYQLDLNAAEIGEILGHTPEEVRRLQSLATSDLRTHLAAHGRARSHHRLDMLRRRAELPVLRARRLILRNR